MSAANNGVRAELLCPRSGLGAGPGQPLVTPIVQSTSFAQAVGDDASYAYSRVSNPTVAALERVLGGLEDAPPAVTFASGLAAETALLLALLRAGDRVVCGRAVYGGTTRLLRELLSDLGIEVVFVDATELSALAAAVTPGTRLVLLETPANPTLELTDIEAAAAIAHDAGSLLAVDNTFLTAVLQRPLDLGADLTVTSTTKLVEGHSAALGGSVVTRDEALLERLRYVRKSTGAIQSPFGAWVTLQGIKTLPLRVERQSASAARVADWLETRPEVSRVCYPGRGADAELAARQHDGAHGAVVSLELTGRADAARSLLTGLSLCRLAEHVGSVETLVTHPASMTHADVPPEQRAAAGLPDGLLRLSIGLEPADAIIADLEQALDREPGPASRAQQPASQESDPGAAAAAPGHQLDSSRSEDAPCVNE
ncbi:MAG: cystathionine gamma-synthase [Planctomycetota bacterium]|nr:MAG: cystathionine gamma-synthase [Planctomycetota bacterium]